MRRGILAAMAVVNLAAVMWAPVAAAQPFGVIVLADQVRFTEGVAVTFTVLTFQATSAVDADAVALEVSGASVPLTATATGRYSGAWLPPDPRNPSNPLVASANATARFGTLTLRSRLLTRVSPQDDPKVVLEVDPPSARPGESVLVTARFFSGGVAANATGITAQLFRSDQRDGSEPVRRVALSRTGTGTYQGTFSIGSAETSADYILSVNGRISGRDATATMPVQRLGGQIWMHLLTAAPERAEAEFWAADVYGRPVGGTELTVNLNRGPGQTETVRTTSDREGRASLVFENLGPGTFPLSGEFPLAGGQESFYGAIATNETAGPGFKVVREAGPIPPLMRSGETQTQAFRVLHDGVPSSPPLTVYTHNRTAFTGALAASPTSGSLTVNHTIAPGDGWLTFVADDQAEAAQRFTGSDPEIAITTAGLRVGTDSPLRATLSGRLRRESAEGILRPLLATVSSVARTGSQPTWQPLSLSQDIGAGVLMRSEDRTTGLFTADARLPRFLPPDIPYEIRVSTDSYSLSSAPTEANFLVVTATARASSGWGSPEVFAGLLIVAAAGIAIAFLPLRRKRPETWDGPRDGTPPASPPNAGTGP